MHAFYFHYPFPLSCSSFFSYQVSTFYLLPIEFKTLWNIFFFFFFFIDVDTVVFKRWSSLWLIEQNILPLLLSSCMCRVVFFIPLWLPFIKSSSLNPVLSNPFFLPKNEKSDYDQLPKLSVFLSLYNKCNCIRLEMLIWSFFSSSSSSPTEKVKHKHILHDLSFLVYFSHFELDWNRG